MNKQKSKGSALRKLLSVLIIIIFILSAILSAASAFLRFTVLNDSFYIKTVTSDKYITELRQLIDNALEIDCKVYTYPYDELRSAINNDAIKMCSEQYVKNLLSALKNGNSEVEEITFPTESISKSVDEYSKTLGSDSMFASADTRALLTEKIVERIDSIINSMNMQKVTSAASSAMYSNKIFQTVSDMFFLFTAVAVVSAVSGVIFCTGRFHTRLYTMASALWFSSTICFAPVMLIKIYNLPSRIALTVSSLKLFVTSIVSGIISEAFTVSLIIFVISTLLLIFSAVFFVIKKKKLKNTTE